MVVEQHAMIVELGTARRRRWHYRPGVRQSRAAVGMGVGCRLGGSLGDVQVLEPGKPMGRIVGEAP